AHPLHCLLAERGHRRTAQGVANFAQIQPQHQVEIGRHGVARADQSRRAGWRTDVLAATRRAEPRAQPEQREAERARHAPAPSAASTSRTRATMRATTCSIERLELSMMRASKACLSGAMGRVLSRKSRSATSRWTS